MCSANIVPVADPEIVEQGGGRGGGGVTEPYHMVIRPQSRVWEGDACGVTKDIFVCQTLIFMPT